MDRSHSPQGVLAAPRSPRHPARPATHRRDDYTDLHPLFVELATLPPRDHRRRQLRDRLVTEHLPVAQHIARRYSHRGQPVEDLTQVAALGLINAVDRFDPHRGSDFLSFAVPTISGEIRRYFRDHSWSIRLPRRISQIYVAINAATGELSQRLGRAPTPTELAEYLGVSTAEVREGLQAAGTMSPSSLDELAEPSSRRLAEAVGADDAALVRAENRQALQPLLAELPERERRILALRFVAHRTQSQIAEELHCSQMHVSRLLTRTLDRLRRRLPMS
jgi:RNA polymerase sigma-B factor